MSENIKGDLFIGAGVVAVGTLNAPGLIEVDGSVDGVAGVAKGIGSFTRSFQGGKIQLYIFWAIFAIIIFLIWLII